MKLPINTPSWAIGLVVFVVAICSSLATAYLTISPDIKKYLQTKTDIRTSEDHRMLVEKSIDSIISALNANSNSIINLHKLVLSVQSEKENLERRVFGLEKDVSVITVSLKTCDDRLAKCEAKVASR